MGYFQMRFDESGIVLLMKTFSTAFPSHSFLRYLCDYSKILQSSTAKTLNELRHLFFEN